VVELLHRLLHDLAPPHRLAHSLTPQVRNAQSPRFSSISISSPSSPAPSVSFPLNSSVEGNQLPTPSSFLLTHSLTHSPDMT
jgi:hypothetical protein